MSTDLTVTRQLVRQLGSRIPSRRLEAERILESLGPTGLEALLKVVDAEQKRRSRVQTGIRLCLLGMFAVVALNVAFEWAGTGSMMHSMGDHWYLIYIAFAGCMLSSVQRNATVALTRYDDIRAVGALADGLGFEQQYLRIVVEQPLIRLLPRLHASDAHLLNKSQRDILNRQLDRMSANPDLIKAILLAWQQVGDQNALLNVKHLAANRFRSPEIRRAAQDCLPFLAQRVAEQNAANTLLRAAGDTATSPGELLRPAHGSTVICADELLRAAGTESPSQSVVPSLLQEQNVPRDTEPVTIGARNA